MNESRTPNMYTRELNIVRFSREILMLECMVSNTTYDELRTEHANTVQFGKWRSCLICESRPAHINESRQMNDI